MYIINVWNIQHLVSESRSSHSRGVVQNIYKPRCSSIFYNIHRKHLCSNLLSIKLLARRSATLLKGYSSNTGVFLWILQNFLRTAFLYRTPYQGDCFCQSSTVRFSQPTVTLLDLIYHIYSLSCLIYFSSMSGDIPWLCMVIKIMYIAMYLGVGFA